MNVVDSCGWLEYFANGANADFFASAIEATDDLLVPSLTLFEVFKRILLPRNALRQACPEQSRRAQWVGWVAGFGNPTQGHDVGTAKKRPSTGLS